jgi:putative transposase
VNQFRSSNKTVYSAKYYLICCPKYRRRVLVGRVADRLETLVREVIAEHDGYVLGLEVMPDHVHVLVEVSPSVPLSRLAQLLKGRSSRRLRQKFPRLRRLPTLWSPSWFVSTVGGAPLDVVKRYVENQKQKPVACVAHRYRLYPDAGQPAMLERHCADARFVWNLALEQLNLRLPGRRPGSADRFRQLAEARKGTWLSEGSSWCSNRRSAISTGQ